MIYEVRGAEKATGIKMSILIAASVAGHAERLAQGRRSHPKAN
jgi:hypothetical protein